MKDEYFLTAVAKDWTEHNLAVIQQALLQAEQGTLSRTNIDEDPLLDTPNLPNYRGVLRWVMVQKHLEMAANHGKFEGVTANWVDLGGAHAFELRGQYTIVTPCHLLKEDDVPRESTYRKNRRIENQVYPLLTGFEGLEPVSDEDDLLHLLLVHGGKDGGFAYLRAYCDPEHRGIYRQLSMNVMHMPVLLPSIDFEPVAEPVIGLKETGADQQTGEAQ